MFNIESFGVIPFIEQEKGVWKVLLILNNKGYHWGFPKGKPNPQETPLQSAARELKEETGLEIERLLLQEPLIERYQFMHHRKRVAKTVRYFPAIVRGDLRLQKEEVKEARWLSLEEALSLLTYQDARHLLKQSYSLLG